MVFTVCSSKPVYKFHYRSILQNLYSYNYNYMVFLKAILYLIALKSTDYDETELSNVSLIPSNLMVN